MARIGQTICSIVILTPCLGVLSSVHPANADHFSYSDEREIRSSAGAITCTHWHDWSRKTEGARSRMMNGDQDPFSRENNYGCIECVNAKDGKTLFKVPSPALTELWISPDRRYLVGLSKIMVSNPYQLVVFQMDGTLVFRKHIAAFEACFDRAGFADFYSEHPAVRPLLHERTTIRADKIFVDYQFMNAPARFGRDNWLTMDAKRCRSHLSENIAETVTNFVKWYREPDSAVALVLDEKGTATGVSVLDPLGVPINIPFREGPAVTGSTTPQLNKCARDSH